MGRKEIKMNPIVLIGVSIYLLYVYVKKERDTDTYMAVYTFMV